MTYRRRFNSRLNSQSQSLEIRSLLSAVTAEVVGRRLEITGSPIDDVIDIEPDGLSINVRFASIDGTTLESDGHFSFDFADIDTVLVTGANGNDILRLAGSVPSVSEIRIHGGSGDDDILVLNSIATVIGDAGADSIWAYQSIVTVDYSGAPNAVAVDLSNQQALNDGYGTVDKLCNVSNVIGSEFDDSIRGDANANAIEARGGNDFVEGLSGDDRIDGGDGNDSIEGGSGADDIFGGNGNDLLSGGASGDTIRGDAGEDRISGGIGNDTLFGGADDDELSGDDGNDTVEGGVGNDRLEGGNGTDTLRGNDGNDLLRGDAGNDTIDGGAGTDEADFSHLEVAGPNAQGVTVNLHVGTATGEGSDAIANVENVNGTSGEDLILGPASSRFRGGPGNDRFIVNGLEIRLDQLDPSETNAIQQFISGTPQVVDLLEETWDEFQDEYEQGRELLSMAEREEMDRSLFRSLEELQTTDRNNVFLTGAGIGLLPGVDFENTPFDPDTWDGENDGDGIAGTVEVAREATNKFGTQINRFGKEANVFVVQVLDSIGNSVEDFGESIGEAFSEFGTNIFNSWDAIRSGRILEGLGRFVGSFGVLIRDVAATTAQTAVTVVLDVIGQFFAQVSGRPLSGAEKEVVNAVFGNQIDTFQVRVVEESGLMDFGRFVGLGGGGLSLGSGVFIPSGSAPQLFSRPLDISGDGSEVEVLTTITSANGTPNDTLSPELITTFVHEMTHVFQRQHGANVAGRSIGEQITTTHTTIQDNRTQVPWLQRPPTEDSADTPAYQVNLNENSDWDDLGVEQQATAVEIFFSFLELVSAIDNANSLRGSESLANSIYRISWNSIPNTIGAAFLHDSLYNNSQAYADAFRGFPNLPYSDSVTGGFAGESPGQPYVAWRHYFRVLQEAGLFFGGPINNIYTENRPFTWAGFTEGRPDSSRVVRPPVVQSDFASTTNGAAVAVAVLQNDVAGQAPIDPSSIRITSQPSNGTLSIDTVNGLITYSPSPGFHDAIDSFGYVVSDTNGEQSFYFAPVTVRVGNPSLSASVVASPQTDSTGTTDRVVGLPMLQPVFSSGSGFTVSFDGTTVSFVGDQSTSLNDTLTVWEVDGILHHNATIGNFADTSDVDPGPGHETLMLTAAIDIFVNGGDGNDHIDLSGVTSVGAHILGGDGADVVIGTMASCGDVIQVGNGDDEVEGLAGNDVIFGGLGSDILNGGHGHDVVDGGSGDDTILIQRGLDTATGGTGIDQLELAGGSGDFLVSSVQGRPVAIAANGVASTTLYGASAFERLNVSSSSDADSIFVRATVVPTELVAHDGPDQVIVSSDAARITSGFVANGNLDSVNAELAIDAGSGQNHLVVSDFSGHSNSDVFVTATTIRGFASAEIAYTATDGSFEFGDNRGVRLIGSDLEADAFTVSSTSIGNTTIIETNGGADLVSVGSKQIDDNGDLDRIQGLLTVELGHEATGLVDSLYLNDRGNSLGVDYSVSPTSVHSELSDGTLRFFAGVHFDGTAEYLQLDGNDTPNIFDVIPSTETELHLDGNAPVTQHVCAIAGDYLRLNTNNTSGRHLSILDIGEGFWSFDPPHEVVSFENIERFNHVEIIALPEPAGDGSKTRVRVFDAETLEFKFEFLAYDAEFENGVSVAVGDVNEDGLPDIVTGPGRLHSPEIRVFNGSPQAGVTGTLIPELTIPANSTYGADYLWGVNVAVGDINGDGCNDIVTAPGRHSSTVKVFQNDIPGSGLVPFQEVRSFEAYSDISGFIGGAYVATGDLDGDADGNSNADIIVGSGSGISGRVRVFDVTNDQGEYEAFREIRDPDQTSLSGLHVATADIDGDDSLEIVSSGLSRGDSTVNIFNSASTPIHSHQVYTDQSLTAPVHVAVSDVDYDPLNDDEIYIYQMEDGRNSLSVQVIDPASGTEIADLNSLPESELSERHLLDLELGLYFRDDYYENWAGLGERWISAEDGTWHYITPSGELFEWRGNGVANSVLVASLPRYIHRAPQLLHEAFDTYAAANADALSLTPDFTSAAALDHRYNLRVASSDWHNWAGLGEKWLYGTGGWYYITPDGRLYQSRGQDPLNRTLIGQLDSIYHSHLGALAVASDAARVDSTYGLTRTSSLFEDWGGWGERWLYGADGWYFLTQDGGFYRWTGGELEDSDYLDNLDALYYERPELLSDIF